MPHLQSAGAVKITDESLAHSRNTNFDGMNTQAAGPAVRIATARAHPEVTQRILQNALKEVDCIVLNIIDNFRLHQ